MPKKALLAAVKELIAVTVDREDITAETIGDDVPLFDDGLGLDSIDALELAIALQMKYGFKIDPEVDDLQTHFRTTNSLADFIAANTGNR